MKNVIKNNRGFTLIELLVVVSIIALLASVVLSALSGARSKARDAKRLADLQQIRSALQLYWTDNGGAYPNTGGSNNWQAVCSWGSNHGTSGASAYIPGLTPTYISVLPTDPMPTGGGCYLYTSDGKDYMFLVYTTVEGTIPNSLKRSISPAGTYAIWSSAASSGW